MNKKQHIIIIATQLFSERGFEHTPISMICEKAKVSKGLIFHYFKSKDDLLRAVFITTTKLIIEINELKTIDQPPKERLIELLESFFEQLKLDKFFVQLNLNIILQPKTRAILSDLIEERSAFILNSVKEIFEKINPQKASVMSYLLIAELDGIALNYLSIFDAYPLQEIQAHLIQKYTQL